MEKIETTHIHKNYINNINSREKKRIYLNHIVICLLKSKAQNITRFHAYVCVHA